MVLVFEVEKKRGKSEPIVDPLTLTTTAKHIDDLLFFAETTRHPLRNRVLVHLSMKVGLRAAEIANLSWDMVIDGIGEISSLLELRDSAAKMARKIIEGKSRTRSVPASQRF